MALDPGHKSDLAALMGAISASNAEAEIVAALVDESWCPGPEEAEALIGRVREVAEA